MKNGEITQVGWRIPLDVREKFTDFCKDVGSLAQEDCAGALMVWVRLPAEIREWAKLEAKGVPAMPKDFWDDFAAGLRLGLYGPQENPRKKKK